MQNNTTIICLFFFLSYLSLGYSQTDSLEIFKLRERLNKMDKKFIVGINGAYSYLKVYDITPGQNKILASIWGVSGRIGYKLSSQFLLRSHFRYGKINNYFGDFTFKEVGLFLRYYPKKMQYISHKFQIINKNVRIAFRGNAELGIIGVNNKYDETRSIPLVYSDKLEFYKIQSLVGGDLLIHKNFFLNIVFGLNYSPFNNDKKFGIGRILTLEYHF